MRTDCVLVGVADAAGGRDDGADNREGADKKRVAWWLQTS